MKLPRTGFNNFFWLGAWVIFFFSGGMVGGPGSGGRRELSWGGGSEVGSVLEQAGAVQRRGGL